MRSEAETRLDTVIGLALRVGVAAAAIAVFVGWIAMLVHSRGAAPDYRQFHGQPVLLTHSASIFAGRYAGLSGKAIMIGILLLIATPVVRVVLCICGFAIERDKLYVLVSSIVLAILLYSLLLRS